MLPVMFSLSVSWPATKKTRNCDMLHKREGIPIIIPNEDIIKESKDVVKNYGLCKDTFVFFCTTVFPNCKS